MRRLVQGFLSRSLFVLGLGLVVAACGDDDDGTDGSDTDGPEPRAGSPGSGGRAGGNNTGAGNGGRTSSGGSGSSSAGRPGNAGSQGVSGSSGVIPECAGLPFEESGDDEEECVGVEFEAEPLPADLFIMMDRSISQGEALPGTDMTRWEALRDAVSAFAESAADSDIRVGIGFFGRTGGKDDALDCDVDYYAEPQVAIGPLGEVSEDLITAIEDQVPSGLTPTLPALQGAHRYAREYALDNPERVVSVVLVTDGYPTQCTAVVSVSDLVDVAEEARTTAPYVRTFVIGLAAAGNLNSIARAGGTNGAYLVDEGDTTASFRQALENITNSPVPCTFEIPEPPSQGEVINPEEVQVVYSPASGEPEEIPRLPSSAACGDQRATNGGWYYNDNDNPTSINVCGCTCSRFGAGQVDIRIGCEPRIGIR